MKKYTANFFFIYSFLLFFAFMTLTGMDLPNRTAFAQDNVTISLPSSSDPQISLELIYIPAGSFRMGSPADTRNRSAMDWYPHTVTISQPFYLGKYEVTQEQWMAVMDSNPSYFSHSPELPMDSVSWIDCQAFIAKLNTFHTETFRLPAEAEWEYACRAGTTTRYSFGDGLECPDFSTYNADCGDNYCPIPDQFMWWLGNNNCFGSPHGTKAVGLKRPNPWGLYDIHGNVWEWCSDRFEQPHRRKPQTDPTGPKSGEPKRVTRGGAWNGDPLTCRSSNRCFYFEDHKDQNIGFRVVMEAAGTSVSNWNRHEN